MKVLVTGGAGFIGSALVARLLREEHTVSYVDNFSLPDKNLQEARATALCRGAREYRVDITDRKAVEAILAETSYDVIYHLAAKPGVRESITNPYMYAETNYVGTLTIFELAHRYEISHVIYASSSSVYGDQNNAPFQEDADVDHPISVYASTKRAKELLAYTYANMYGMNLTGLRFFTVYGPFGRPDMAPFIFTRKISRSEPIQIFNHGAQKRDFTYIDDIVDGCYRAIEHKNGYQIFNLGNDTPVPLMHFIECIESNLGKVSAHEFLDAQKGDVTMTHADITKARNELGYNPTTTIEEGVSRFIAWYREYYGLDKNDY